jgi:hypothetical protein
LEVPAWARIQKNGSDDVGRVSMKCGAILLDVDNVEATQRPRLYYNCLHSCPLRLLSRSRLSQSSMPLLFVGHGMTHRPVMGSDAMHGLVSAVLTQRRMFSLHWRSPRRATGRLLSHGGVWSASSTRRRRDVVRKRA